MFQRFLIYAGLLAAITVFYLGVLYSGMYFLNFHHGDNIYIGSFIFTAAVGVVGVPWLAGIFQKIMNRWFEGCYGGGKNKVDQLAQIESWRQSQCQVLIDISHSLQNPLTVMKAMLDSLRKKFGFNTELEAVEKTADEISKRAYDLVRLVRLEMREEAFNLERLNLSQLLKEIGEYVWVLCDSQDLRLVLNIEDEVFVFGDRRKLEEMVNNLLSNALKYSGSGQVVKLKLKKGIMAEIIVEDSGVGILPEFLPYLFERFSRAKSNNRSIEGMGVGLAITKKIVEKHRGNIRVKSMPRHGSTFIVSLPLVR